MKNNHEIILKQYAAYCKEQPLYLGTAGSYGMEMLTIIREGVWAEYDILAAFHPPVGAAVQVRVGANNQIGVPIEATAEKGMGEIVFAGYKEGVRQIAVDVLYKVAPSSGASGTEPAEPTPDVVQQILSAANGAVKTADGVREDMDKVLEAESGRETAEADRAAAESARVEAETARVDAEADRAAAEKERQTAESARSAAENDRQSVETSRARAEIARVNAEEERADYERLRKDHETQRITDETVRQTAESKRQEVETARADAESKRAVAEQSRVKAETDRVTSETARKDAESKRASAEQERQTAEQGRTEAETARVEAEAEREKQLPALKSSVDELRARQNILVGSETGNPIAVDDAFAAPLCGLTVYGKSTQDGTPTPDAPVPIVSAGDGGTVTAKVTGANLLDLNVILDLVQGASQSTIKDGRVTGTTKSPYAQIGFILKDKLSTQYTVSLSGGSASVSTELRVYIWNNNSLGNNVTSKTVPAGEKASCTFKTDGKHEYAVWFRPNGVSDYDYYDIQLELGSTATAYEPYHEQLLTLQTPTGLPGIPVTSGGNYTDSRGQQWVCDEVNLERGMKVQRVDKAAFDSTKTLAEQDAILATPVVTPLTPDEIAAYKALIAYGPDTVVQASDGAGIKLDYQRDVNLVIKNLEDAIASMTTT